MEMRRECRKYLFVFLAEHTGGGTLCEERMREGGVSGEIRDDRKKRKKQRRGW